MGLGVGLGVAPVRQEKGRNWGTREVEVEADQWEEEAAEVDQNQAGWVEVGQVKKVMEGIDQKQEGLVAVEKPMEGDDQNQITMVGAGQKPKARQDSGSFH